jgi:hypothetical protein
VTVFDKSARQDGTFLRDDFAYDHARDAEHPASLREQSRIAPPNAPTIALDPARLPPDLFNRICH